VSEPGGARVAAVVDVGSNSVLLLTIRVAADGAARAVDEAAATTRLGTRLRDGGALDPDAATRTTACVVDLVARARHAGATDVWAFATGAARRAADGAAFARALARAADVPVAILDGAREAALAYAAAAHGLALPDGSGVVVDVGGATTEVTLGRAGTVEAAASLPIGALVAHERHADDLAAVRRETARLLATIDVPSRARGRAAVVVSGGTATSLAALSLGLARYDPRRVHGAALTAADLPRLATMPAGTAIDPGRAAILPAGACILGCVLDVLGATVVGVSDHGVRHAYLGERLAARGVAVSMRALWS